MNFHENFRQNELIRALEIENRELKDTNAYLSDDNTFLLAELQRLERELHQLRYDRAPSIKAYRGLTSYAPLSEMKGLNEVERATPNGQSVMLVQRLREALK
jgi:hypothetical protein